MKRKNKKKLYEYFKLNTDFNILLLRLKFDFCRIQKMADRLGKFIRRHSCAYRVRREKIKKIKIFFIKKKKRKSLLISADKIQNISALRGA